MSKIIKIEGCKTCPYSWWNSGYGTHVCEKYDIILGEFEPETPHLKCKLTDLPTEKEIVDFALDMADKDEDRRLGFIAGANYVLNKIK